MFAVLWSGTSNENAKAIHEKALEDNAETDLNLKRRARRIAGAFSMND
jgi:hypothetical protein